MNKDEEKEKLEELKSLTLEEIRRTMVIGHVETASRLLNIYLQIDNHLLGR